jgi:hypothetical protein
LLRASCARRAALKAMDLLPELRFAPLHVPLRRRLQTAAVLCVQLIPLALLAALCALLFSPPLVALHSRTALAAYVLWIALVDRRTPYTGGRPWPAARTLALWRWAADYFPAALHVTAPLDPSKRYVLVCHPHGVLSLSVIFNLLLAPRRPNEALGGLDYRIATVTFNSFMPLWREVLLWLGFVNADRDSLARCLADGLSVVTVVGGAVESLSAGPGRADITLEERKGFVRLALTCGADLVPVYAFGENELFSQVPNPEGSLVRRAQEWVLRTCGFTTPLFYGRGVFLYSFGFLPRRVPLHTVVGPPLAVPRVPPGQPLSPALVDAVHAQYVAALRALYDAHAPTYYPPAAAAAALQSPPAKRGRGQAAAAVAAGAADLASPPALRLVR